MKLSINTNKKQITSTLVRQENYKIRLYIRDEPHPFYTGDNRFTTIGTRELAKMLSIGFVNEEGVAVPARRFMQQFRKARTNEIIAIVNKARTLRFKGMKAQETYMYAGQKILELLVNFMHEGNVTPENASFTLLRKEGTSPLEDTGQLLTCIDVEVKRAK